MQTLLNVHMLFVLRLQCKINIGKFLDLLYIANSTLELSSSGAGVLSQTVSETRRRGGVHVNGVRSATDLRVSDNDDGRGHSQLLDHGSFPTIVLHNPPESHFP